jgi:hypothetical protein
MMPIDKILPTRGELIFIALIIMVAGWGIIEFVLWLSSFVRFSL